MLLLALIVLTLSCGGNNFVHSQQHHFDPAYLRQYYQQLQQQQHSQQSQQQHLDQQQATTASDGTPIYEHNVEQSPSAAQPQQQQHYQLRAKDNVQEQIRVQQQTSYVAPALREYLQRQPQQQAQVQQQLQYQAQPQQVLYHQPQSGVVSGHRRPQQAIVQQYQSSPKVKAKPQGLTEEEEEEYDDQNSSYQFGFDVKDDEFTNYQNRKEVRDGGVIKGSYSVVDSDGFIRTVKYTADPKEGFKAEVIREPTDIVVKIPTPAPPSLLRHRAVVKAQEYAAKQQLDY